MVSRKIGWLLFSLVLYVMSLLLPSAKIANFETGISEMYYGYEILASGWLAVIFLQPAWLSNVFYILALVSYDSKVSRFFGVLAVVVALASPFQVTQLSIGFYLWISAFFLLLQGTRYSNCRKARGTLITGDSIEV